MSDTLTTSRPSSSAAHHHAHDDAHSHGTASPAILTPVGTPPTSGPGAGLSSSKGATVLGASAGSTSSSSSGLTHMPHLSHFPHHHSHLGHNQSHSHQHQLNTGRWNPFSETRLQQLLSPFDAGSGWRASSGSYKDDADLEGMMRKLQMTDANAGASGEKGTGSKGQEALAGTRFEKRALSQGAVAHANGNGHGHWRSGLSMTAAQGDMRAEQSGVSHRGGARDRDVEEEVMGKAMARRQSMPEGHNTQVPLRRPSLSFLSNLSMTRPSPMTPAAPSGSSTPNASAGGAHANTFAGSGSAITDSPAPSRTASPAIRPSSAASQSSFTSMAMTQVHDLKPLSEIPASDIGAPAMQRASEADVRGGASTGPGAMQRSKTLTGGVIPTQAQVERRHFDPCREPKLLHFM